MSVFLLPDPDTVTLGGLRFAALTEGEVVHRVRTARARGIGGRIATPNVDILRQAAHDRSVRADLETADLLVADGAPLVWAARIAGTPLPERVTGSGLIWSLSAGLALDGASVYLLGGSPPGPAPGGAGRRGGAERAADALLAAFPGLRVAGHDSPPYGFDCDPHALRATLARVVDAEPDLVYVGLGFPKQERLIEQLRPVLSTSWFLGCGAAINFVAGDQRRAPVWMQRGGLEWAHRLAGEPRRLAGRYLRHDAPYAARLLVTAAMRRERGRADPDEWPEVVPQAHPRQDRELFPGPDRSVTPLSLDGAHDEVDLTRVAAPGDVTSALTFARPTAEPPTASTPTASTRTASTPTASTRTASTPTASTRTRPAAPVATPSVVDASPDGAGGAGGVDGTGGAGGAGGVDAAPDGAGGAGGVDSGVAGPRGVPDADLVDSGRHRARPRPRPRPYPAP